VGLGGGGGGVNVVSVLGAGLVITGECMGDRRGGDSDETLSEEFGEFTGEKGCGVPDPA
jgi:hypothetical protein